MDHWKLSFQTGPDPIARDASMLLYDMVVPCPLEEVDRNGGLLAPRLMTAFAHGLGEDAVPAPVLLFFIGLQLLQRWSRMPVDPGAWSARRAQEFNAVQAAALRVLGDAP